MQTITLNNAIKNFAALPPQILHGDEVINVATDDGNIILISEENYRNLVLQCEVNANPAFKESLLQGLYASPDELVPEDGLPFEMRQPQYNAQTEAAIAEARGIIDGNVQTKTFSSLADFYEDLDGEDDEDEA